MISSWLRCAATVLTVYGIETGTRAFPFNSNVKLQQSLPFTVLKRVTSRVIRPIGLKAATVLTVYGIETKQPLSSSFRFNACCNSPYRLRYAPKGARQQRSEATMRSAHLKYLSEAKVKQR